MKENGTKMSGGTKKIKKLMKKFERAFCTTIDGLPVLVFWDVVAYVVICIKHDIVSQGPTIGLALERFEDVLKDEKFLALSEKGSESLNHIPPPPKEYIEAYKKCEEKTMKPYEN